MGRCPKCSRKIIRIPGSPEPADGLCRICTTVNPDGSPRERKES